MIERLSIQLSAGDAAPAELPQKGRLVIGSSTEKASFVLDADGVDPVHCAIGRLKGGGWALRDLGSSTGTKLNGAAIRTKRLSAGDVIALGSAQLDVFDPSQPPPEAQPKERKSEGIKPSIEGYKIERAIGRGGMGNVFLAVQESLARKVALKILSPKLAADADFVRRFKAEARAAAALNHPNVVTIYDVGESNGQHYLSMEYMAGGCLETRIASSGPLPWRVVLDQMHDAASGLVFAESRRIVHRDIKPANLMISETGAAKIADLGLAVQVEKEELQGEGGKIYGTPHFIAPELIRGAAADSRSDLYSLGATAYRLVSGRTPFEGETAADILRSVLRDEPKPLTELVEDIPPAFAELIERLLAKEPSARADSAQELLQRLATLRADESAGAEIEGKGGAGGLIVVGLLVVIAAGVGAFQFLGQETDGDGATAAAETPEPAEEDDFEALEITETIEPLPATPETTEDRTQNVEAEAALAYIDLRDTELTPEKRIEELKALADKYLGTDTANAALKDAERLRKQLEQGTEDPANAATSGLQALITKMEAVVPEDVSTLVPIEAQTQLATLDGRSAFANDPEYKRQVATLEDRLVARALVLGDEALADAEAARDSGDFQRYRQVLEDFVAQCDLSVGERTPARYDQLTLKLERARDLLNSTGSAKATFQRARLDDDARTTATQLGLGSELESKLRAFDIAAAQELVAAASAQVQTSDFQAQLGELETALGEASAALQALASELNAGGWKRRMIYDPRDEATREALDATSEGLRIEVSGSRELIPWSAWPGSDYQLHHLFNERLSAPWPAAQKRGIATLLTLSATLGLMDQASDDTLQLTPEQVEEAYSFAREWNAGSELMANELAAAQLFVAARQAERNDLISEAIAHIERMLAEYPLTLIVLLSSDATSWRAPRPKPQLAAPEPAEPDAPSSSPDGE